MKTLLCYIAKVKTWGIKGVWNFFCGKIHAYRLRRFFLANARRYPMTPEKGITLIAPFGAKFSLSKVMRDLAFSLKESGIPFQTFDLGNKQEIPDEDLNGILTPKSEFKILRYSHVIEMFQCPLPSELNLKRSTIVFWEFDSGLLEFQPSLANAQHVIAMSDYNLQVFKDLLPNQVKVSKILYPFRFNPGEIKPSTAMRNRYGIPEDAFVVFFNFDYNSSFNRKNPDGAIRAFSKAFANTPTAWLVFKTNHAAAHPRESAALRALALQLGLGTRFVVIDEYIPICDLYSLTNACDVYLSLHRGEGFGLGVAEAMSLGKAVVITDYSSTTEFCTSENSIPIPYELVEVKKQQIDNPCYMHVKKWAEPNIGEAANALTRLYMTPKLRLQLGENAKTFIQDHFSNKKFRLSIMDFLRRDQTAYEI